MRVSPGALTLAFLALAASGALEAQQLREDSYRWFIAPQGGAFLFETQTQSSSAIPVVGAQALIIGKRGGLIMGRNGACLQSVAVRRNRSCMAYWKS